MDLCFSVSSKFVFSWFLSCCMWDSTKHRKEWKWTTRDIYANINLFNPNSNFSPNAEPNPNANPNLNPYIPFFSFLCGDYAIGLLSFLLCLFLCSPSRCLVGPLHVVYRHYSNATLPPHLTNAVWTKLWKEKWATKGLGPKKSETIGRTFFVYFFVFFFLFLWLILRVFFSFFWFFAIITLFVFQFFRK